MSRFFVFVPGARLDQTEIDFPTFVSIVRGTSIVSLADSDTFLELGLSENLMLRIEKEQGRGRDVVASVLSTLNTGEVSPTRIQLINEGEAPAAALVERRLYSLRQSYAIMVLINSDRQDVLAAALRKEPKMDVEQRLLREDERLYLQAAGPGSWWVVALTKIKGTPQTALNTLALIYGEGRGLLLDRVRAETHKKLEEVERERDRRIIELSKALDKVKDERGKAAITKRLFSEMNLTNPELAAPVIAGLLPAPETHKASPAKKSKPAPTKTPRSPTPKKEKRGA